MEVLERDSGHQRIESKIEEREGNHFRYLQHPRFHPLPAFPELSVVRFRFGPSIPKMPLSGGGVR